MTHSFPTRRSSDLVLRQRRRRRLIIRGWRRVGGNRDDQRQSNHRLFDTSHPYSPFLCAGGIRPPRCFDQIFTSRSRSELAITLTEESAITAAAMIGDNRIGGGA